MGSNSLISMCVSIFFYKKTNFMFGYACNCYKIKIVKFCFFCTHICTFFNAHEKRKEKKGGKKRKKKGKKGKKRTSTHCYLAIK